MIVIKSNTNVEYLKEQSRACASVILRRGDPPPIEA